MRLTPSLFKILSARGAFVPMPDFAVFIRNRTRSAHQRVRQRVVVLPRRDPGLVLCSKCR